jgi:hypothetical protein
VRPWQICLEQTLKKFAVVGDFEMEQFVYDNEFLKTVRSIEQFCVERDPAIRGAGSPLARHSLNSNLSRTRFDFCSPVLDRGFQLGRGS